MSDASSARVSCRRERPEAFGASVMPKRPFVASTTRSVTSEGRSANQRPMISSETPRLYTFAVSTNVPPAATNVSSCSCEPASSVSEPKVMVPRQRVETAQPLDPRVR